MNQLKPHEAAIVLAVAAYEAETGRKLPAGSFYKALAVAIIKKYGI